MEGKFEESFLLPAFCVKPTVAIDVPIPREKLNPPTPSIYVSGNKQHPTKVINIVKDHISQPVMGPYYIFYINVQLHPPHNSP